MNRIVLTGCRPSPLAGYLKALGVFRLLSQQQDPRLTGCWDQDQFVLSGQMTQDDLIKFFVERYEPTPIVSPWNGGSGFYDGDPTDGIEAIASSDDPRLGAYRATIERVRQWPEMPQRFRSVDQICQTLQDAASRSRGSKADKLQSQSDELRAGRAAALKALFGDAADPDDKRLSDVETIETTLKSLRGKNKTAATPWVNSLKKARTTCKQLSRGAGKTMLLSVCRARLPEESICWFDAAVALNAAAEPCYSPVLGSGGNEGRFDFSNNFMQRISELLLHEAQDRAAALLGSSLFGTVQHGLLDAKIGQFDPGRAGGYNQGAGVETKDFKINPWDLVLVLEGAACLGGSVHRRNIADPHGHLALPFTVSFSGVGFASSEHTESGRAETWLPVWSRPATFAETKYMFSEGRAAVGRKMARTGLDFARSVGSLGVDRGIDGFVRYAFVERRGKSYVALPAGQIPVRFKPSLRLLDDIDPIRDRIGRFIRGFKNPPATFASAARGIDNALYACALDPSPQRFSDLLCALGRFEARLAQRERSKEPKISSPLSGLRAEWISACDDGGPELRLAAAIASIGASGKVGAIRCNLAGVSASAPWKWDVGAGQQHWRGSSLAERLAGVVRHRLMDAKRFSVAEVPLYGRLRISPVDVLSFLYGETDDQRLEELLWGLTLLKWPSGSNSSLSDIWRQPLRTAPLPRGWCALKLLHMPGRTRQTSLRIEPRIAGLLSAGRLDEATDVAVHRLRVSGLAPLPVAADPHIPAERQLAALLVPTRQRHLIESLVLQEAGSER